MTFKKTTANPQPFIFLLYVFLNLVLISKNTTANNIILNGDFSNDGNSWSTYIADYLGVTATWSVTNEKSHITGITVAPDSMEWHVQLIQNFSTEQINELEKGETYIVSFDASSESELRPCIFFWGLNTDPYTPYIYEQIYFSKHTNTYYFECVVDTVYDIIKLCFNLGQDAENVIIDNVRIVKKSMHYANSRDIIFITDDNDDDNQINFLKANGYNISTYYPSAGLAAESQTTIDWLNSADLVIIGRSPSSSDFESPNKEVWNALTVPLILNSQWTARSHKINWFDTDLSVHYNTSPDLVNAQISDANDIVFEDVNINGDSLDWCVLPHDFIRDTVESNAHVLASYNGMPVYARFEPEIEFYPGSGDLPAGYRTYFGFGNNNAGMPYFFPLTDNAKKVYLGEIHHLIYRTERGILTDPRDGQTYKTVKIGDQWWMADNLNYGTYIAGGTNQTNNTIVEKYCFNNIESDCDSLGGLYQWDEMMDYELYPDYQGICPAGWHVPSDDDWKKLEIFLGMSKADADLFNWRGTDQGLQLMDEDFPGFNSIHVGYMLSANNFVNENNATIYWTSTPAYARYILSTNQLVYRWNNLNYNYGLSLRCMKNDTILEEPTFDLIEYQQYIQTYMDDLKFGDFNNDNILDILFISNDSVKVFLINPDETYDTAFIGKYVNGGKPSPYFPEHFADIIDFNSDNYLDFMVSGYYNVTQLYINNRDGTFSPLTSQFKGAYNGADWGDYDNDGDYDFIISGKNQSGLITTLYKNEGNNQFNEITMNIPGVFDGTVCWGDFDNDYDLDLLITGTDAVGNGLIELYKNDDESFNAINLNFPMSGYRFSVWAAANFVDLNNDSYLDILFSSNHPPSADTYLNMHADSFVLHNGDIEQGLFGDLNNDGFIDVQVDNTKKLIYTTEDLIIKEVLSDIETGMDLGDFDNDGDLDILAKDGFKGQIGNEPTISIYKNNTTVKNSIPSVPLNLNSKFEMGVVYFNWDKSYDKETPQNGLTYNIRIGTTADGIDVMSPMSDLSTGLRRIASRGNTGSKNGWKIKNLKPGKYYWSVQAIDNSYMASEFAPVNSFIVPEIFEIAPVVSDSFDVISSGQHMNAKGNWGDYDNDGDLDILFIGDKLSYYATVLLRNELDSFKIENIDFPQMNNGSAEWGDYDNDGDLDFFMGGSPVGINSDSSKIYQNEGDRKFISKTLDIQEMYVTIMKWGDSDNDGDLDILISGRGQVTEYIYLYINEGNGNFINSEIEFPESMSDIHWVDYNNDGFLDIMILTDNYFDPVYNPDKTYLFKNNQNNTFVSIPNDFPKYYGGFCDWGDIDNDGDLDILMGGSDESNNRHLNLYENDGDDTFTKLPFNFRGFFFGYAELGDLNNDGWLDILVAGSSRTQVTNVYLNLKNNSFAEYEISEEGDFQMGMSSTLGDYDNDRDLDICLFDNQEDINRSETIYENMMNIPNAIPPPPTNLDFKRDTSLIYLSWDKAFDSINAHEMLSYNVRIGTTKNGVDVLSPMADIETGYRLIPELGNAGMNLFKKMKVLLNDKYYWSVQSIDHSLQGGPWAPVDSFIINDIIADFESNTVCLDEPTQFMDSSTTVDTINTWKWDFGDGNQSLEVNPQHLYEYPDTFDVTLWVYSNSGDSANQSHKVIVKPKPIALFSVSPVCYGTPSLLYNESDTNKIKVKTWSWDYGDGSILDNTRSHRTKKYLTSDTAILTIIAENNCWDTYWQPVTVYPLPDAAFTLAAGDDTSFCANDSAVLNINNHSQDNIYSWFINDLQRESVYNDKYVMKNSGKLYLIAKNNEVEGCEDISRKYDFTVYNITQPNIEKISGPDSLCPGEKVKLKISKVLDGFDYDWRRYGISINKINQTSIDGYLDDGQYTVVSTYKNKCPVTSNAINIEHRIAPEIPKILVNDGPDLFYMSCDNTTAKEYKWYYNGNLQPNAKKYYYFAGSQLGRYYVVIKEDYSDCYVKSYEIMVPGGNVGINDRFKEEKIVLFPNPTDNMLSIYIKNNDTFKNLNLSLLDLYGRSIHNIQLKNSIHDYNGFIDMSSLPDGIYYLKIKTDDDTIVKKIIKE